MNRLIIITALFFAPLLVFSQVSSTTTGTITDANLLPNMQPIASSASIRVDRVYGQPIQLEYKFYPFLPNASALTNVLIANKLTILSNLGPWCWSTTKVFNSTDNLIDFNKSTTSKMYTQTANNLLDSMRIAADSVRLKVEITQRKADSVAKNTVISGKLSGVNSSGTKGTINNAVLTFSALNSPDVTGALGYTPAPQFTVTSPLTYSNNVLGATITTGPKGDTGLTGPQGNTGATGPAGINGTNGTNGTSATPNTASTPLSITANNISIATASSTTTGALTSADWNTFNNKLSTAPVTSVFGRTGVVVAVSGDYTTTLVTEGVNQYFTQSRARSSISLTNTGSGVSSYNSTTGVLNIPDPTITLTAGNRISVTGSYPNFTIAYIEPTIHIASRTLNSAFTVSSTLASNVVYSVTSTTVNPLLVGTATSTATLQYSTDAGTTWVTIPQVGSSSGVGLTVTVQLTQGNTIPLVGLGIPKNALVKIITSGTVALVSSVETY